MSAEAEMMTNMLLVLARVEKKLDQVLNQTAPKPPSDDESIGRDPSEKYWQGDSYKGCKLSDCPPDYLRAYARYRAACAWAARKNDSDKPDKMKYADRDEKTAKLATAWAEYREALGYTPAPRVEREEPDTSFPPADGERDVPIY